jgi:predicted small lipoprotein YifL
MRKFFIMIMLVMAAAFISGCSEDGPLALPDEQGKEISFENMDQPALVFFFTGIE